MIWYLITFFAGSTCGLFVGALCNVAGRADAADKAEAS